MMAGGIGELKRQPFFEYIEWIGLIDHTTAPPSRPVCLEEADLQKLDVLQLEGATRHDFLDPVDDELFAGY